MVLSATDGWLTATTTRAAQQTLLRLPGVQADDGGRSATLPGSRDVVGQHLTSLRHQRHGTYMSVLVLPVDPSSDTKDNRVEES